jgi:hypothetical protein
MGLGVTPPELAPQSLLSMMDFLKGAGPEDNLEPRPLAEQDAVVGLDDGKYPLRQPNKQGMAKGSFNLTKPRPFLS